MKSRYPVNRKLSFRENFHIILPMMFDNMMMYKKRVSGHPRIKKDLHRMRITGKPIRYLMEIMENEYGKEFGSDLIEIKSAIELMGEIHDCDVFMDELKKYVNELRAFNGSVPKKAQKFPTSSVLKLVTELKMRRNSLFNDLCKTFDEWEKNNFKERLIKSMNTSRINEINYFRKNTK
jgi:CHAD domain-containing protein